MAASDRLQLQVILQAIDRATEPLKRIGGAGKDAGRLVSPTGIFDPLDDRQIGANR